MRDGRARDDGGEGREDERGWTIEGMNVEHPTFNFEWKERGKRGKNSKHEIRNPKQIQIIEIQNSKRYELEGRTLILCPKIQRTRIEIIMNLQIFLVLYYREANYVSNI